MNNCIFVGRMVADPELRHTQSGIANCSFRIAVNRQYKNAQGNYDADFIACVAWKHTAEFVSRYLAKGDMVAVRGALQNRTYEAQDGSKRYVTEIIVDNVQPCGGRKSDGANTVERTVNDTIQQAQEAFGAGFVEVDDDELPF